MNSEQIFTQALNIESPWFVKEIKFETIDAKPYKRLLITLDFERGAKFTMSDGNQYTAYDTEIKRWQHLNFFEHECYIEARVPRVKNNEDKVVTVSLSWARPGSGFTMLFEAFSMFLVEQEMPISKVAKTVRVTPTRIWRVFDYWINKAIAKDTIEDLKQIGIDETSSKKGHNYVTVTIDIEKRRVIHAGQGKDAICIKNMVEALQPKGLDVDKVEHACIDMSPAFISGLIDNFPNTKITFDKFHIKKLLNEAFDKVRQSERKGNEMLKGHKYTFLKAYEKLSLEKKQDIEFLSFMYPKLGEAYRLKILFDDFWDIEDVQEASGYLAFWCDLVVESKIYPLIEFTNTIKAHWSGIVNYIKSKISAGVIEGINNKIQLAKRRARGYKNINNFINMIYFLCGKLKFDYPLYSL